MAGSRNAFEIRAEWDGETRVWRCANGEMPLATAAPTFERPVSRVIAIVPKIAPENALAAPGHEIELRVIAERGRAVQVATAA